MKRSIFVRHPVTRDITEHPYPYADLPKFRLSTHPFIVAVAAGSFAFTNQSSDEDLLAIDKLIRRSRSLAPTPSLSPEVPWGCQSTSQGSPTLYSSNSNDLSGSTKMTGKRKRSEETAEDDVPQDEIRAAVRQRRLDVRNWAEKVAAHRPARISVADNAEPRNLRERTRTCDDALSTEKTWLHRAHTFGVMSWLRHIRCREGLEPYRAEPYE